MEELSGWQLLAILVAWLIFIIFIMKFFAFFGMLVTI